MNKYNYIAFLIFLALGLGGCTKKFESFNTDPTGIPNQDLLIPSL